MGQAEGDVKTISNVRDPAAGIEGMNYSFARAFESGEL